MAPPPGSTPPGKGDPNSDENTADGSSGAQGTHGGGEGNAAVAQADAPMSIIGSDPYSVGFILILVMLGMLKAAYTRCTC